MKATLRVVLIALCVSGAVGCVGFQHIPSNIEVGYNQMCYGADGRWYPGDPFAPVENNSGCLRYGVQPNPDYYR